MTREAKIKISADVASLKRTVNEAKATLESLNQVKINPESIKTIKDAFDKELQADIEKTTKKIAEVNDQMNMLGKTATGALSKEFKQAAADAKSLHESLEKMKKAKADLAKGGMDVGSASEAGGGKGIMAKLQGGAMKAAGVIGVGMGLNHLKNVALEQSKQRVAQRSLTGGSQVDEKSDLGYTPEERRERATTIAKAMGRNMSAKELTDMTDFGEQAERAFGMEQGTLNEASKEGRKAGVENEQKFLAQSMGTAIAKGMEGSKIGEYLSAMTGFMSELSDSITVSPDSINGFASAFGDIPFFKNDPSRLFSQMRGMDGAFKGGDRFQQAQAARAMLKSNPNANIADMELRKQAGLFGDTKGLAARYAKMGANGHAGGAELAQTMGIGGSEITNNMFGDATKATSKMKLGDRINSIMSRLNLQGEGGQMLAADIIEGKKVSTDDVTKAQMSAEEQLKFKTQENMGKSFSGVEKTMLEMNATIKQAEAILAGRVATGIDAVVSILTAIANKLGITDGAAAVANTATAGAALYAGKKVLGTSVGKKMGEKVATSGASKMMGKMVGGKMIPGIGTAYSMLESEDVGAGSDKVDEFEYAKSERDRAGVTSSANIPFATGLSKKEKDMAEGVNPVNVVSPNPSGMSLPEVMKTTDTDAIGYLKIIAENITGRSGGSTMVDRRPAYRAAPVKTGMN